MGTTTHVRAAMLAVAMLCGSLALPMGSMAAVVRPVDATGPLGEDRLSDEFQLTRVARSTGKQRIHKDADAASTVLGTLRLATEDGYPEVYLVLRSHVDAAGVTWLRLRIPGRPNGRLGWVRSDALGPLEVVRTHLLVRRGHSATLYRNGRIVWHAPVGSGKRGTETPAGHFWIREKFHGDGRSYGPRVFGTSAYSKLSEWPRGGIIGIHGTDEPRLVPGFPSHGCIRMHNADISRLYRLMPVGTPVHIV